MGETANSELELSLQRDTAGVYKTQLIEIFNQEHVKISRELNKGVKPGEYDVLHGLLKSIEEAIDVVESMWEKFQN